MWGGRGRARRPGARGRGARKPEDPPRWGWRVRDSTVELDPPRGLAAGRYRRISQSCRWWASIKIQVVSEPGE